MEKIKMISAICIAILCSCQKNVCAEESGLQTETIAMTVKFGLAGTSTRSFLDDMAEGWAWENEVYGLNLYVYGPEALAVAVRANAEEIARGQIQLKLPGSLKGVPATIYAVANSTNYYMMSTEASLNNKKEAGNLSALNVGLPKLWEGAPISGGLLMSGKVTCIPDRDVSVNIELKRVVAKIIIELHLSDDFNHTHDGSGFTLKTARVQNESSETYIMEGDEIRNARFPYIGKSVNGLYEDGVWRYILYTHEINMGDEEAEITVGGSYYIGTTDVGAKYHIPVDAANPSIIRRNACYRIKGEIYGLGFTDVTFTSGIEEWTILPQQDISIGG